MRRRAPAGAATPAGGDISAHPETGFWTLAVGCIGVVYGDIGTSPLYAFRESALAAGGADGASSQADVLGILSLIFWALIIVVTLKYVLFLTRADNRGEGGTLALMALAQRAVGHGRAASIIVLLGIVAAALFYGDAMLTPALSVLSAVEGLEVAAPQPRPLCAAALRSSSWSRCSWSSHRGTARVASFFGPITVVWFIVHCRSRASSISLAIRRSWSPSARPMRIGFPRPATARSAWSRSARCSLR